MVVSLVLFTSCSNGSAGAPSTTGTAAVGVAGRVATPSVRDSATLANVASMTALGDSVPYGTACNCTPFPQLAASEVARLTGHVVSSFDDAVPGFQSSDVLQQVQGASRTTADVENSDVVMIEAGANDIAFSSSCETDVSCYTSKLSQVAANITAIVVRVRQLSARPSLAVVLLDYWSVWLGGQYAKALGPAYVNAERSVSQVFSDTIRSIAMNTGSIYVDLAAAFRGPDDDADDTNLLAPDGDHPNAAGQKRIAETLVRTFADPRSRLHGDTRPS